MPTNIETDLKDLLLKIDSRLERMEERLTKLEVGQENLVGQIKTLDERTSGQIKTLDERISGQIKALDERTSGQIKALDERTSGQIKALDEKLSGKISTLDAKVDGVGKRLENQEFLTRSVVVGLLLTIVGGLAKLFGFLPPNP